MTLTLRRVLAGPATVATFLFLVVPFGLGWLKTALFSPLALPGYIIYAIGSAVGHRLAPQFGSGSTGSPSSPGATGFRSSSERYTSGREPRSPSNPSVCPARTDSPRLAGITPFLPDDGEKPV
ncbi:hypothetical protein ACFQMM_21455 [Saliphagus sp. GCM10025308]